jgi:hypothetical protein
MARVFPAAFALTALFTAGCGDSADPIAGPPVVGKVAFKDGRGDVRWLVGGKVRLQSVGDPKVVAVGVIDEDGSFAADTHAPDTNGVPPGEYVASVLPPVDRGATARESPVLPKYHDPKTSGLRASVPSEGTLTLTVEGPTRRRY